MFLLVCFVSQRVKQDAKKPHQKILFPAEVMNFFKSGSQYNYYTLANFKPRYIKTTLGTFFRTPCMVEVSNLVVMFL